MYLGSFGIDDYLGIPAATHRFSSGAAYAPTVLTYSIYEEATAVGLDEDVDMTPASPFDSITGCYWVRRQLTAAAGFEAGKNYLVVVKATVDSVAAIQMHTFQVAAKVDARYLGGTAQTGRDIGASVLLSSGSGAGQLDFTSGVVKANLAQILGTALTETSGLIAAAFKKFFNVATPTGTVNSLPDAVPGAASGLAIVGSVMGKSPATLAAGDVSGNLPTDVQTIKTQAVTCAAGVTVLASVGTAATSTAQTGDAFARLGAPAGASVSADVAAVKGDTAAIKTKTDNLPASPAAVGSAMTLTAAYDAAKTAASATTALSNATWTDARAVKLDNLDAAISTRTKPADTQAAVTTVTNLTNAPTAGDLTSTMKASVTAAVPTAVAIAAATGAGQPASESYAADGALPTRDQAILAILQLLSERSISSTTMTVKKLDGSTTAMTFTLDDADAPTSITRAT